MKFENVLKIFIFGSILSGCISRQPEYVREIKIDKNNEDKKELLHCVGNQLEFTGLGRTWNTLSYGALGVPYGFIHDGYKGYKNPKYKSFFSKSLNSSYNAFKGLGTGCYNGLKYGYQLKYSEGRSVEGHIFDTIELMTNKVCDFIKQNRQ